MNTDTGKVYEGPEEVAAALSRGENLVEIGTRALRTIREGRRLLAQKIRNAKRRKRNRRRDALQRQSRRRNRRSLR